MPDVIMPRLSDSMEEGTIIAWLVADGSHVKPGQLIAEIETDKATMTFEAEAEGQIALLAAAGDTASLGATIARIATAGEPQETSSPTKAPENHRVDGGATSTSRPPSPRERAEEPSVAVRASASPVARRIAAALHVDLGALIGTGPGGRIVRADVERAASESADAPRPAQLLDAESRNQSPDTLGQIASGHADATQTFLHGAAKGSTTVVDLSRTQQVIARRMAESRATVPDFIVEVDVDMQAAWDLRRELKGPGSTDPAPSLNDIVVMACAKVLSEQPNVNSAYRNGHVEHYGRVNIGVAITAPAALVVATVFDADQRSLGDIARTTRALAEKVRDGSITPPELAGATFTVSNLGMFGVDRFTAVINVPQAAILAVGAVRERAVAVEDCLVVRRMMTVTLSADHRVVYGADAAMFLARMRELLEQPLSLVIS